MPRSFDRLVGAGEALDALSSSLRRPGSRASSRTSGPPRSTARARRSACSASERPSEAGSPCRGRRGRGRRGAPGAGPLLVPDAQAFEELPVERGVAKPDHGAAEARRVKRRAQDLDDLDGALRRGRADQLDSRLEELAGLPALGADRAVGAGVVEEAEGRLGGGVAVGDQARDRQRLRRRASRAAARAVEEAVARPAGPTSPARESTSSYSTVGVATSP